MSTWTLPKESLEWVGPLTVTANGVATTTFQVALVAQNARPDTFKAPDALNGQLGILVGPGGTWPTLLGTYSIWVRVTSSGETPVLNNAGTVVIV